MSGVPDILPGILFLSMKGIFYNMNSKKTNLTISLMLAMFLTAVEGTIVTMATPTIAKNLHGLALISLVFSVYLLTSAISTPIYGKLADLYGRKKCSLLEC